MYALKFVGYVCILYVSLICSQWQGHNISGKDERIHCSININTETGRLSARRPNLQVLGLLEFLKCYFFQSFIFVCIFIY